MAGKREAKREDLKERLIAAAYELIRDHGLKSLRARDVAEKAGCALGGLYTVFDDLDGLILHVHSRTLGAMDAALRQPGLAGADLRETFRHLALAYLRFARENYNLWSALFEHRLPEGARMPEWLQAEQTFLIRLIAEPLALALPGASEQELALRARTLFGAVHGVVSISLEDRFTGIAADKREEEVAMLADILASGIVRRS
ncbi:TetR/AcrR family transcriptional regulator [Rhizobiaceae bacterium BDR2-2]|uniref:TetR/AcrR family transcriptional regulator n=1 Tax=Ectorhizobium quercum TaxID=2965071 RepID=A0AAE3SVT4_9HYPH|nr:TetR/AcrR family transcriptional regulator [Ectorhizobium quercum]MCX8998003.1 TetR/AcrR family transcriptional regulator [Ectorhizobium quercum]